MAMRLARRWWALAVRGLLAIFFGVLALTWPIVTLHVLVLFYGAYALADGVFSLLAALGGNPQHGSRWWMVLLEGLAGVAVGVITFVYPEITEIILLYLIASWAVVTGFFEILAALRLRKHIQGEWVLALAGVLSVLLGVIMFARPGEGLLFIVWVVGIYAILFGVALLVLALRLRQWSRGPTILSQM
jgi:uncharacterized membrane protein HdeD (DUF308 family)